VSASSSSLMKKRSNGSSSSRSTTFWTPPPSLQIFLRLSSAKVAARCLLEVSGDARDAPKLVSKNSANAIEKQSRKNYLALELVGLINTHIRDSHSFFYTHYQPISWSFVLFCFNFSCCK
jgi:hypothetical protein